MGNAKQPCPEVRSRLERGDCAQRLQERLLSHVFRDMPIARQTIEPAVDLDPVLLDQGCKGATIAGLSLADEIVLARRSRKLIVSDSARRLEKTLIGQSFW